MIHTRNVIFHLRDLDSEWCFKYLLGISYDLGGGDIKILSPLSHEKTPSFCLYKNKSNLYRYKCFSSGNAGDHIDLQIKLLAQKGIHIDRKESGEILKNAFSYHIYTGEYVASKNGVIRNGKGKVTKWELRRWNEDDIIYWQNYYIDIPMLEFYNVAPIDYFEIEKLVDGIIKTYYFKEVRIYGYFRKDGSLHKIYRPGRKGGKFIKVGEGYTMGADQIFKPRENLIYIKSLKDIMAFRRLSIDNYDAKSPDAESTLISKEEIERDKKTYKKILIWMDPDSAGKKAEEKYKKEYDLDPVTFDMGPKDLSDSLTIYNPNLIRLRLLQLL